MMLAEEIPSEEIIATDAAEIASTATPTTSTPTFLAEPGLRVEVRAGHRSHAGPDGPRPAHPTTPQRANAYDFELEQMDAAFKSAIATIPEANRKLVVYHDSWSYYGRRYGLPVIGAIQPADFSRTVRR